jgi:serine/threonine-protein kinase LATS1/2
MKTLKKNQVLAKNQVAHVWSEKDILSEADNDWIVKLYYSFQDQNCLYFVMEYIPGGDLMTMLIKEGTFSEELSRFYIAELTCAVESVHNLRFIHRDIKPDNILIDAAGHIKLTDFGLCTGFRWTHSTESYQSKHGQPQHYRQDSMDPMNMGFSGGNCSCPLTPKGLKPLERRRRKQEQRETAHSLVGTPNYIAPEILGKLPYTQTCDWWSVGVILYEMVIGRPPFNADDNFGTQTKVLNWRNHLHIPSLVQTGDGSTRKVSPEVTDLIRKLCCDTKNRLGTENGALDIKRHPFFNNVNFNQLRRRRAPPEAIPKITHPEDTSNFDTEQQENNSSDDDDENNDNVYNENGCRVGGSSREKNLDNNPGFYEFTFRRFFDDGGHPLQDCQNQMDIGLYNEAFMSSNSNASENPEPPERPPPVYV